jgi:tetratricopeptide (TPR) repeat protein
LCKVFIELAWLERSQDNFDNGQMYADKALLIAKKNNYTKLSIDIYNIIGVIHEKKHNRHEAIIAYDEALNISKNLNDKLGIARILNNKGNVIEAFGDIETAETMYLESWSILQQIGDTKRISIILSNLGDISFKKGDYESAEKYHRKSLEIKTKLGNKKGISTSLGFLALNYFQLMDDENAKKCFIAAIKIQQEIKNYPGIIRYLHRAFSLFNKEEKDLYYQLLKEVESIESFNVEQHIIPDIELIYNCELDNITSNDIFIQINRISDCISKLEGVKNEDIDDLPIEAFYIATQKLIALNSTENSKKVAKQALELIGDRKTRRKEELQKIANSTAYNSV